MLEKVNLSQKTSKEDYRNTISELETKLGSLLRRARDLKIPLIVAFEGWGAAGKSTVINRLILSMDPRQFKVDLTKAPNEEERLRPFLWRFWVKTPELGRTVVFDQCWYRRVLSERVDRVVKKPAWSRAYGEINSFERQLVDGGTVIVKFYFHISKKEQKKRFEKLQRNPVTALRVTKEYRKQHKQYRKYVQATEDMLAKTDTAVAPWTIVPAHDRRFATVKVFRTVIGFLEQKIKTIEEKSPPRDAAYFQSPSPTSSVLDEADLSLSLTRIEYEKELKRCQNRLIELEYQALAKTIPVVIVYEGWDASGKGGNIRRLAQAMDPRGYEVIPIAAPTGEENSHPYLWRFWKRFPRAGHIAIFDRSWYGRVLVERVEGFAMPAEWRRAYKEINEMEEQWVNFGSVLIKFWIHIDQDEQLKRFRERQENPFKKWKITDEDWRNREKWADYQSAVDEMLRRTSTTYAPWTILEGNCKLHARIKALRTVQAALEDRL